MNLKEELKAERDLINAATAGPWELDEEGGIQGARPGMHPDPELDPMVGRLNEPEDNDFTVHARTALPLRNAQLQAVLRACDAMESEALKSQADLTRRGLTPESDRVVARVQAAISADLAAAKYIRRAIEPVS